MEHGEDEVRADDPSSQESVLYRTIEPDPETAEHDFLAIVADLDDVEIDELPPLYTELDHLVERLFETPPSPQAQVTISFSYAGYRVTITQDGAVELVCVKDSLPGR